MSFRKRFETNFVSYNGQVYHVEIWDKNYTTGAALNFNIGAGGPEISYESDDDNRFSTILCSTCSIPVVIQNDAANMQTWINSIIDSYEERDVYVHVYLGGNNNFRSLWSGYLLMDLSNTSDESKPYDFTLNFTDGLSILKDIDFVVDESILPPYSNTNIYWGPSSFTFWISQILQKGNFATTTEGASFDYVFSTSVNWYNTKHNSTAQSFDPMNKTLVKVGAFAEKNNEGTYKVKDCYEVLKELLRHWGCRIVYWRHQFWIIQIPNLLIADTGTAVAPDNVNTRVYTKTGAASTNLAYLGSPWFTPYTVRLRNAATPTGRVAKMSGTKYGYQPPLKKTSANFIQQIEMNAFKGFPESGLGITPTLSIEVLQDPIVDAASSTFLSLKIPLVWKQNRSAVTVGQFTYVKPEIYFNLKATDGSTTKYLHFNGGNISDVGNYSWSTSVPQSNGTTAGSSTSHQKPRWTCQPFYTGSTASQTFSSKCDFDILIPTDSAFTGNFTFSFIVDSLNDMNTNKDFVCLDYGRPSSSGYASTNNFATCGLSFSNALTLGSGLITTTLTTPSWGGNNRRVANYSTGLDTFEGKITLLNSSAGAGTYMQQQQLATSLNNSQKFDFGEMFFGDADEDYAYGSLKVTTNAGADVFTDPSGQWGVGTLSGTKSFTQLLLEEYMKGQITAVQLVNMRLVTDTEAKRDQFNRPQYVNPVGRVIENDVFGGTGQFIYVFQSGKFNMLSDEWDYNGFELKSETISGSSTSTTTHTGGNLPTPSSVALARVSPNVPNAVTLPANSNILTYITAAVQTQTATTSLTVQPVPMILKSGQKFRVLNAGSGGNFTITTSSDVEANATTIPISSITLTDEVLAENSIITFDSQDMTSQYQNKTSGTVGNLTVSNYALGPLQKSSGGVTNIVGMDYNYIKILPHHFLANDDNTTYSVAYKDGSGQTGVVPEDGALELFAFVNIPYGKTATTVDVFGSNAKTLNVYVHNVNDGSGLGTSIGTGAVNTTLDITDTAGTDTNFLTIKITTTATSNRIFGGKVTLIDS